MHVYADLQAYICTWPKCSQSLSTFSSRKVWAQHETSCHLSRTEYQCPECDKHYDDDVSFLGHVREAHHTTNLKLQATILQRAEQLVKTKMEVVACHLCQRTGFVSTRDYTTHVGRHLEDVALIALPPIEDEGDVESRSTDSEYESVNPLASQILDTAIADSAAATQPAKCDRFHLDDTGDGQILCSCGSIEEKGPFVACQTCGWRQHKACDGEGDLCLQRRACLACLQLSIGSNPETLTTKPEPSPRSKISTPVDPLYSAEPGDDGLYQCPLRTESGCDHRPTKQRAIYR